LQACAGTAFFFIGFADCADMLPASARTTTAITAFRITPFAAGSPVPEDATWIPELRGEFIYALESASYIGFLTLPLEVGLPSMGS